MRSEPCTEARRSARSWVRKISGRARQKRMARHPRSGLASSVRWKPGHHLVPPEIEGADRDAPLAHGGEDRRVGRDLLFLGRETVRLDEEELRAEQPDAVGAVRKDGGGLIGHLDIRLQGEKLPVEGFRGQVPLLLQRPALSLPRALALVVADAGRRVGVHDDRPAVAVHDDSVAAVHVAADVREPEHGGDLPRPREDGGVGGLPARVRRDAQDELPVEAQRVGGHEIARHEDRRLAHVGEARPLVEHQAAEDAVAGVVRSTVRSRRYWLSDPASFAAISSTICTGSTPRCA